MRPSVLKAKTSEMVNNLFFVNKIVTLSTVFVRCQDGFQVNETSLFIFARATQKKTGEKLIQIASDSLVTEILIHPQVNTFKQCARNLMASFTRHRYIVHAGYTLSGTGSWVLQVSFQRHFIRKCQTPITVEPSYITGQFRLGSMSLGPDHGTSKPNPTQPKSNQTLPNPTQLNQPKPNLTQPDPTQTNQPNPNQTLPNPTKPT